MKKIWFRRKYKVGWMKYCQMIVVAHKIAICHYKKTIQSLRKKKMNVMVSLGQWLYFLRPLPVLIYLDNLSETEQSSKNDITLDKKNQLPFNNCLMGHMMGVTRNNQLAIANGSSTVTTTASTTATTTPQPLLPPPAPPLPSQNQNKAVSSLRCVLQYTSVYCSAHNCTVVRKNLL